MDEKIETVSEFIHENVELVLCAKKINARFLLQQIALYRMLAVVKCFFLGLQIR